jgi:hypothetical protein
VAEAREVRSGELEALSATRCAIVKRATSVIPVVPGRRETRVMVLLCVLAALRVFLFSAAFPFFNNVDEQFHFDLVHKYARGHLPAGFETLDSGAARDMLLYGSPEYLVPLGSFPGGTAPPPVWTLPFGRIRGAFEARVSRMTRDVNYESTQPPLYYAVAGLWYRLGQLIGLRGGQGLYWIRFMNVIVCALLVWLAHLFARALFPADGFLRLGMPLLVAFFPQDVLYSVNNDVLLPLVGGGAFLALLVLVRGEAKGYAFHALAGVLVAAAVLVKLSSAPLAVIAVATALLITLRAGAGERRGVLTRSAVLLLSAGVPLAAWGARNALVLGDVTGSAAKAKLLGWSLRPLGTIFDHPLFTAGGIATFWQETMTSFWRGEFTWGLERIASGGWDLFFGLSSLVLPAAAVAALVIRRRRLPRDEQVVQWLGLAMFLLSLLFLAGLSVVYDFDGCFYPSRDHPFLTSGRLALAALLPFMALYLTGLEVLLPGRRTATLRWVLLISVVALMSASEIGLSHAALHSAYNWFHLL